MGSKKQKGQIAVFLSIILLAMVILVGILIDGSRIFTGETQVKSAVSNSARSVLADYGSKLKNQYGIFAFNAEDEIEINEMVKEYIMKNLIIKDVDNIDENSDFIGRIKGKTVNSSNAKPIRLYDYRIDDIKVTPLYNLTENEVVKDQILEYMKFRAPKQLVDDIWEKLNAVKDAGKISEAYREKTCIDRLLGRMDKYQKALKENIDGKDNDNECYVNKFNVNMIRDNTVDSYSEVMLEYSKSLESRNSIDKLIYELEQNLKTEKRKEEIKKIKNEISNAKNKRNDVSKRVEQIQNELNSLWVELRYNQTSLFLEPNREAQKNIEKIIELGKEASTALNDLENYMQKIDKSGEFSKSFTASIENDINNIRKLVLDGERAKELISNINKNFNAINAAISTMDEFSSKLSVGTESLMSKQEIVRLLNYGLKEYNNSIEYPYLTRQKLDKKDDPRKERANEAKKILENTKQEDIDIKKSDVKVEELPSRKKVASRDFEREDTTFVANEEEKYNGKGITSGQVKYEGKLDELDKDIDFVNEDSRFSENAFGFISSIGDFLTRNLINLRDDIYINEYILGTFKNSVPVLKTDTGTKNDLDLRGNDKQMHDTFFESEVEYILHGNTSQKINKIMTEGQILLIRFGMNTLHVYMDTKKKEFAEGIAAAVAGWWTGGAGIPIISNLIMCGWGMGEAVIDLKDLLDGRTVPFFKSKGDWKMDIGLKDNDNTKTDPRLSFTYHDYLRLLLLLENQNEKISRVEDLIQLNLQKSNNDFYIKNCNTYLRVEATISMNYLFLTHPFMPDSIKTRDGRHKFKVIVYEGY